MIREKQKKKIQNSPYKQVNQQHFKSKNYFWTQFNHATYNKKWNEKKIVCA